MAMSTAATDSLASPTPAGLLRRLAAIGYDSLLLLAIEMVAAALWLPIFGDRPVAAHPLYPVYQTSLALVAFAFFAGFWLKDGQTLGMRTWRLRLIRTDGRRPSLRHAVIRYVAAALSWLPAGLGFWWALLDPRQRTWHDLLSGTLVVHEPRPATRKGL